MWNGQKMFHLAIPLGKIIDQKIKNNRFKSIKDQIYAIKSATYKGLSFYIFVDADKKIEVVFNTSPIDAAFVEFTRVIGSPNSNAMVYTQHILERYNQRVHNNKYNNHKDMLKRLIVNNPMKKSTIFDDKHKIVMKVQEGFLSGSVDITHKILIMNTFFDKEEYEDNKLQHAARTVFDSLGQLTPQQFAIYEKLNMQRVEGKINYEEFIRELNLQLLGPLLENTEELE